VAEAAEVEVVVEVAEEEALAVGLLEVAVDSLAALGRARVHHSVAALDLAQLIRSAVAVALAQVHRSALVAERGLVQELEPEVQPG
jgi:hypothetical protein